MLKFGIDLKRERYHIDGRERFGEPEAVPAEVAPTKRMAHMLRTEERRVNYALRRQTVEPVLYGIIKLVLGFR